MNYGSGMIWPLAAEYARLGWAVRRAGWDESDIYGDSGRALRWVVYQNALFWLLFREVTLTTHVEGNPTVLVEKRSRVIRNTDFKVEEFYAEDWTVLTPECFSQLATPDLFQQGKKRYPRPININPISDPMNPNSKYGACPVVPLYDSIRFVPPPTQAT